jgi:hypothetical protein
MLAILPVCFRAMSAISLWSERYVLFCIQYWTQNTQKQTSNTILTQKIRLHIVKNVRMPEKISGNFKTSANFLRKYENSR